MRPGRFTQDCLKYYVYLGRAPTKKVKTLMFRKGVPGAVWDRKIHALMTRLPYFREATEEEIVRAESTGKKAPAQDQNADRDALRAELDRRGIKYHHAAGPKKLLELLNNAPLILPEPAADQAEAA